MIKRTEILSLHFLRFFLVISILFYHASRQLLVYHHYNFLFGIFNFGLAAVDTFFMLSGYLLGQLYMESGGVKTFLKKRFLKIYPFYLLATFLYLPIYVFFPHREVACHQTTVILKSLFLWPQSCSPVLAITWFLSYQFYFYLLFSFLKLRNKFVKPFLYLLLLASFILYISKIVFPLKLPFLIQFLFSGYNLEFFTGVFLVKKSKSSNWLSQFLFLTAALGFYVLGSTYDVLHASHFRVLVYGLMSYFLMEFFLDLPNHLFLRWQAVLRQLSAASYGIILFHFPILTLLSRLVPASFMSNSLQANFSYLILTLLAFCLSFIAYFLTQLFLSKALNVFGRFVPRKIFPG